MSNTTTATLAQPIAAQRPARSWFQDARHFQIIYLSMFLLYGILFLGWQYEVANYFVIFGAAFITQLIGVYFTKIPISSLKSAAITALGLCLLLKANSMGTLVLAASVAIGSKFLLRTNNKHIFNPANFGIIVAILLTGDAWISPGQWGSSALLVYFIGALGLIVLLKVGRIDTSLWFFGAFALLEYYRTVLYLGWETDVWLHKLCNGSLLLFTFFMITDPKTTPNSPKARAIWAVAIAVITFIVSNFTYLHTAPIWTLVFFAPVMVILDKIYKHKKFEWNKNPEEAAP